MVPTDISLWNSKQEILSHQWTDSLILSFPSDIFLIILASPRTKKFSLSIHINSSAPDSMNLLLFATPCNFQVQHRARENSKPIWLQHGRRDHHGQLALPADLPVNQVSPRSLITTGLGHRENKQLQGRSSHKPWELSLPVGVPSYKMVTNPCHFREGSSSLPCE